LRRTRTVLLAFVLLMPLSIGQAQEKSGTKISGHVIDDSTHTPIVNANVFLANTMIGAATDTSGGFVLKNVPAGFYELVASCVGYSMRTTKIQVVAGTDLKNDFSLVPRLLRMNVVEVTAAQPAEWQENLKLFTKLLLGTTPEASRCRITNPEVLDFTAAASGHFHAQTDKEVSIENVGLGYTLRLSLGAFNFDGRWLTSEYKVRFEELKPLDPDARSQWQKKRVEVYSGSLHHFLNAMIRDNLSDAGYTVYNPEKLYQISGSAPIPELKRYEMLKQSAANTWTFQFRNFLVIVFDRKEFDMEPGQSYYREYGRFSGNPSVGRKRPQISILSLTRDHVVLDERGQILDQLALKVSGDWGKEGLAAQLPMEFDPDSK
jgi:hypothetical protein